MGTYGKPQHFYTDGGKDFRSNHVKQIATDLGFICHLRHHTSDGGIVERPFKTFNDQLFSTLPGYTNSNVQERPKEAEKDACLTLRELEQLIVRFIVDRYNQSIDARMGDQTRFQRWEAGLPKVPDVIDERQLDICLMKATRRTVQRGGYLQFENLMYRGEYLAGYAGERVSIRFDPDDITTIFVYQPENNQEIFLARAYADELEDRQLSFQEAKAISRRLTAAGKAVNNRAIRQVLEEDALVNDKKTRKQRQKEEQKLVRSQPEKGIEQPTPSVIEPELEEPQSVVKDTSDLDAFEPIDFDELGGDW